MSKLRKFFTLFTLGSASLIAYDSPGQGEFEFTGQFLYALPSVDETYFVVSGNQSSTSPVGTRENNDFEFNPGFRVGAAYGFCNCNRNIQLWYTHYTNHQSKTVTGSHLWATLGHPNTASDFENYSGYAYSNLRLNYQSAEAVFAQQTWNCCGLDITPRIGVEFAYLRLKETAEYVKSTETGFYSQYAKTWGIGPELGFEMYYTLYTSSDCNCPSTLTVNALTAGSLLASRANSSVNSSRSSSSDMLSTSDHRTWRMVPALHARVGLNYAMQFSSVDACFEVGYEFNSYIRGLSRTVYPDDVADGSSFNNYFNMDMQGFYASAGLSF